MIATMPTNESRPTTGHDRAFWFAELDAWGAAGRPYREIADWLTTEQGLSAWWAQKLIVEYEEARGCAIAARDATGRSRPARAGRWPPRSRRCSRRSRTRLPASAGCPALTSTCARPSPARWSASTGPTARASRRSSTKGPNRTTIAVEHQRLPDAALVPTMRTYWQERLEALRSLLEE